MFSSNAPIQDLEVQYRYFVYNIEPIPTAFKLVSFNKATASWRLKHDCTNFNKKNQYKVFVLKIIINCKQLNNLT